MLQKLLDQSDFIEVWLLEDRLIRKIEYKT